MLLDIVIVGRMSFGPHKQSEMQQFGHVFPDALECLFARFHTAGYGCLHRLMIRGSGMVHSTNISGLDIVHHYCFAV